MQCHKYESFLSRSSINAPLDGSASYDAAASASGTEGTSGRLDSINNFASPLAGVDEDREVQVSDESPVRSEIATNRLAALTRGLYDVGASVYDIVASVSGSSDNGPSRLDSTLSLGDVDEDREAAQSEIAISPRKAAMMRLHKAASSTMVFNDHHFTHGSCDDEIIAVSDRSDSIDSCLSRTRHERNAGRYTIIAFVNSGSGGQMGNTIYEALKSHLGAEHVFDLKACKPGSMPEDILINYAQDPMVRVLACGGDGTCGWIFSSLDKVWSKILGQTTNSRIHDSLYRHYLPVAIMPLGTGNDLSRQFGWGGSFQTHMKDKEMLTSVQAAKLSDLDRWRCIVMPLDTLESDEIEMVPKILMEKNLDENDRGARTMSTNQSLDLLETMLLEGVDDPPQSTSSSGGKDAETPSSENAKDPATCQILDGVFCNYLSIGMDAKVTYLFHQEREAHPEKFTSTTKNKLVYIKKAPAALMKGPKLKKFVSVAVNDEDGLLVELEVPKSCREIMLVNIQSYAGGYHPTSKGSSSDGLIEVIFVLDPISYAVKLGTPFFTFKVAARTNNVCIRTRMPLHMQVDGEPWLQKEGVIQVKFHSRNSILTNVQEQTSQGCSCMGGAEEAVIN